jgi:hypothetical protein
MGHHYGSPLGGRWPRGGARRPRVSLGAGGQGWPSLEGGLPGGGATYPFHLYKGPLGPLGSFIHLSNPLLSSLAPLF